ncbi:MAG TPA: phosphate/phosphonate ABC transporter substrate-binding protein [Gammaproteobacteria bacterium]|nr:phosphate/phosphonate ABC transporter substrate-binding protein [Gammaproteobacteria bacterium]
MPNAPLVRRGMVGLVLLVVFSSTALAQGLIFTAPPRESPAAGAKLYGPLAEALTRLLGKKVTYQHPENWLRYQRNMRNDTYDIIFDGPHFASWRMTHLGHRAVAKLPGTLEFYLLRAKDNPDIKAPEDLIGKKICGISPPNLSTLSVLARFDNPVRQPIILGIRGGMGKVYKRFMSGSCDALVLRTTFYKKKLKPDDRAGLEIIYHTPPLPNQVITVSKRLSPAEQRRLAQALTTPGPVQKASLSIVKRFGGKARSFVKATQAEYEGHNALLEGVIFGW